MAGVIQQYQQAAIPLETFVADLQYMNNAQIFTLADSYPQAQLEVCACS